jgi:hypothetical protein
MRSVYNGLWTFTNRVRCEFWIPNWWPSCAKNFGCRNCVSIRRICPSRRDLGSNAWTKVFLMEISANSWATGASGAQLPLHGWCRSVSWFHAIAGCRLAPMAISRQRPSRTERVEQHCDVCHTVFQFGLPLGLFPSPINVRKALACNDLLTSWLIFPKMA